MISLMSRPRILCIDDDASLRTLLVNFLASRQYEVREASNIVEARRVFHLCDPDAVLLDYMLPDGTAMDLLPNLLEEDPDLPVILITGHGDIEKAVAAIRAGAAQFLTKPVALDPLETLLRRSLEGRRERRRARAGQTREQRHRPDPFLGSSPQILALAEEAKVAARADSPVLLLAETGSGKGVLARWIHDHGARRDEALVDLNCAGLSRELLESELFGHARGAFTGAVQAKPGLIETANRGTLFLDEIGDLDLGIQPRILKVVEEKRFRRLGEVEERHVDVRLIVASNRDLQRLVQEARFRADLFFRVNTLTIRIPPLRERRGDIGPLAESLVVRLGEELGRRVTISSAALRELESYDYPGNIRELRNILERAILVSREPMLTPRDLRFEAPPASLEAGDDSARGLTLAEVERRHVERTLRQCGGHVERTAELLGVPRSTLYQRIKAHRISLSAFRTGDSDTGH